jgi:signal transduction histidine kinase/CheY-like chemotaxis protein
MLYQALDVEGVMFIDASVYARRKAVGSDHGKRRDAYNIEHQERHGGNEEDIPSATKDDSQLNSTASEDDKDAYSLVLGHCTSSTSESFINLSDSHYVSLSGSFISHLIDQYPRGKIFHVEEDGSISLSYEGLADEMHYPGKGGRGAPTSDSGVIDIKQETSDIQQLMKVLPDAGCVAIYPIFDFQRGRYFTVSVVWANDPGRVLSEPKDLTYLAAFSNTVMAEVSRLDLEAADRAKGDFISSISHELRSPLHGLLGTVELLQEMVSGYAQHSLIETVYSCGRTLLDTLNHLLDYAKINTLSQPTPLEKPGQKVLSEARPAVPGSLQDEDLGILVQEVVEGILAGVEYQRRGADGGSGGRRGPYGNANSRLITIVDIEWNDSWRYSVYAGAWRRVVMNLFGNALKYTQTGYIRLFMRNDTLKRDGQNADPAIRMTFSDSGRGMSKDFIANHLYTAFHQEDTTSPGLGVGLHLVHQIVKSLNGTIDFASELGKGTDVDVVLPINPPEDPEPAAPLYGSLKEKLQGKTISLFMQSSKLGDIGIDPKVFNNMLISLGRMTTGWFGLRVLTLDEYDRGEADFAIVTEHEYKTYYRKGSSMPKERGSGEIQPTYPLIVLSERASSWRTIGETMDEVIILTQPVSPKTLATAFEHCLDASATALDRTEDSDPMSKPEKREQSSPVVDGDSPNEMPVTETAIDGETDIEKGPASDGEIDGATAGAANGASCANDNPARHRILLVEDNQVNLKVLEMCVKAAGFTYETATNGLEALERFKDTQFDVVIMDVSMPVMDGLTATREMRKFERRCRSNCQQNQDRKRATIIALTAVLSASTQHEATVSGVDLFLTKPAPLKQLKEILQDLRRGKEIGQE